MSSESRSALAIKWGKPVFTTTYKTIRLITTLLTILLLADIFYSLQLMLTSFEIRTNLGYFINMIASGDGEILPMMQAIPVTVFLVINIGMAVLLYKSFDEAPKSLINRLMFVMVILGAIVALAILIIVICVIAHAYGAHESLHDGIVTAMVSYSSDVSYKAQMDHLQIEFQCCGSKKYDEWYAIKWQDPSLQEAGSNRYLVNILGNNNLSGSTMTDGNTPFSCCSRKSPFPCIHHNVEITGKVYLYTPEHNLSISTRGCYEMIREKKQEVGWGIVGDLLIYLLLQVLTVSAFRLIQTAHFEELKFSGSSRHYTMWIIGIYSGKVKQEKLIPLKMEVPTAPPMSTELID